MDSLVSAGWLRDHIDEPDLTVLDCSVHFDPEAGSGLRTSNGYDDYLSGHIPGAHFADLFGDISDRESPLEFGVPSPEQFAAAMAALGVGDDSRVVLYDRSMSMWAARVWWMLRWVGFDAAALLDGGMAAWEAVGGELSDLVPTRTPARLTVRLRPELIAGQREVRQALDDPSVHLIDTLSAEIYRGDLPMYNGRAGHIPSATNISAFDLITEQGTFRPPDEITRLHEGYDPAARTITYCGGGIAASVNAFAMTRLGFTDVAIYAASLEEWTADPANPMATGSG